MSRYLEIVRQDDPVALWMLDDSTLLARDLVKDAFTGTSVNSPVRCIGGLPNGEPECRGMQLLASSTQAVTTSASASLSSATFSVEGWYRRPVAGATDQMLVSKGQSGAFEFDFYAIRSTVGGVALFNVYNTSVTTYMTVTDTASVQDVADGSDGSWEYLCGTCNPSGPLIVIYHGSAPNGKGMGGWTVSSSAAATVGTRQGNGAATLNIANRNDANFYASGIFCGVAYYNYALTEARAKAHFLAGLGQNRGTNFPRARGRAAR